MLFNPETKFKTISIVVKFKAPLKREIITTRSLLSKLLTRVTSEYPTEIQLNNKLADTYGANLYSYVMKQQNAHIVTIGIDFINDKYLTNESSLLERAAALLHEVIFNPLLIDGTFSGDKLSIEKQLLEARFNHVKENKTQRAFLKMMSIMFENSDFKYPSYGIEEDLKRITVNDIKNTYDKMLLDDEIEVLVIGDVPHFDVEEMTHQYLNFERKNVKIEPIHLEHQETKVVTEPSESEQSKLNIGMHVPVTYGTKEYFAFLILNQIYGGDVSSLLFMNVREKQSLAYQVHSQIDARLGLLYVIAGVDKAKTTQATDTILYQLELIERGEFDDNLVTVAKTMLVSHRKELFDRPKGWIESSYAKQSDSIYLSHKEWFEGIESVTKEDVMSLASNITVDTIYIYGGESFEARV